MRAGVRSLRKQGQALFLLLCRDTYPPTVSLANKDSSVANGGGGPANSGGYAAHVGGSVGPFLHGMEAYPVNLKPLPQSSQCPLPPLPPLLLNLSTSEPVRVCLPICVMTRRVENTSSQHLLLQHLKLGPTVSAYGRRLVPVASANGPQAAWTNHNRANHSCQLHAPTVRGDSLCQQPMPTSPYIL